MLSDDDDCTTAHSKPSPSKPSLHRHLAVSVSPPPAHTVTTVAFGLHVRHGWHSLPL